MDLYLETSIASSINLFKQVGFNIISRSGYVDAILNDNTNCYHIHFAELDGQVYADLHYETILHFMFLGVDHNKKPPVFFREVLEPVFKQQNIPYNTNGTSCSWLHRRNKAIFWGLRF